MNGANSLNLSADRYEKVFAKIGGTGGATLARARSVNRILIESERRLTDAQGLPGRPWFQHQIYAPGFYTGYGVKTLPGIR